MKRSTFKNEEWARNWKYNWAISSSIVALRIDTYLFKNEWRGNKKKFIAATAATNKIWLFYIKHLSKVTKFLLQFVSLHNQQIQLQQKYDISEILIIGSRQIRQRHQELELELVKLVGHILPNEIFDHYYFLKRNQLQRLTNLKKVKNHNYLEKHIWCLLWMLIFRMFGFENQFQY